jgi:hypothetical protein
MTKDEADAGNAEEKSGGLVAKCSRIRNAEKACLKRALRKSVVSFNVAALLSAENGTSSTQARLRYCNRVMTTYIRCARKEIGFF